MGEAYLLKHDGGHSRTISVAIDQGSVVTASGSGLTRNAIYKNGRYLIHGVHDGAWSVVAKKGNDVVNQYVTVKGKGIYNLALTYFRATITVSASKNSTFTMSGPESQNGAGTSYTFTVKAPGTYTIRGVSGGWSHSGTVTVTTTGQSASLYLDYRLTPEFSYNGSYKIVDDNDSPVSNFGDYSGGWKIRLLSSGTFNFTNMHRFNGRIDAFIVAGGRAGTLRTYDPGYGGNGAWVNGAVGSGGAHTTVTGIQCVQGEGYSVSVGGSNGDSSFGGNRASGAGSPVKEWDGTGPKSYSAAGSDTHYSWPAKTANTGDGGNGCLVNTSGYGNPTDGQYSVSPGASGIVVIRNAR